MAEYIVPPNNATALEALKRVEFNFLRAYAEYLTGRNITPWIRNELEERDIDPRDLTVEQVYNLLGKIKMFGFRKGVLSRDNGFTRWWIGPNPRQRQTDNKYCIPLPSNRPGLRAKLNENIPNVENYIEEEQPDWFPDDDVV